jgi:Glu-tRNA(Gln) amidotransferase subunit E-like FAD-binding protein
MAQDTRVKLLAKLLENPDDLTDEDKEKLFNQLINEIDHVKDPEIKKKLITDMLTNLQDLPSETMTQLLSNMNDLPSEEQKELLKQILEKFDELPPEMKEKLVDDLLKSAAGKISHSSN